MRLGSQALQVLVAGGSEGTRVGGSEGSRVASLESALEMSHLRAERGRQLRAGCCKSQVHTISATQSLPPHGSSSSSSSRCIHLCVLLLLSLSVSCIPRGQVLDIVSKILYNATHPLPKRTVYIEVLVAAGS